MDTSAEPLLINVFQVGLKADHIDRKKTPFCSAGGFEALETSLR